MLLLGDTAAVVEEFLRKSLEVFVEEEESKAVEGSSAVTLMVGLVPTDIVANILELQIKRFSYFSFIKILTHTLKK